MQEQMRRVQVVLLGNTRAGKTNLANVWCKKERGFQEDYCQTTGVNFFSQTYDGKFYLRIWDLSGQERFQSVCNEYVKTGEIFLLAWDPDDYKENKNAAVFSFFKQIKRVSENSKSKIILLRTKSDKHNAKHKKEINDFEAEIKSKAEEFGFSVDIPSVATSSKNNTGFERLDKVVRGCLENTVESAERLLPLIVVEPKEEKGFFKHSRHAREADIAQYETSSDKKDEKWLLLQCASIEDLRSRTRNKAYNIVLNNFRGYKNEGLDKEIEGYKSGIVYELLSFLDKQERGVGSKFSSFFSTSMQEKIEKEYMVILKIARNIYDFENSKNNAEASANANNNNANDNNAKVNRPNFYFGIDDHDIPEEVKAIVCKEYDWMRYLHGSSAPVENTEKRLGKNAK